MRSNKLFLGVLAVVGIAAAYWFLLLAPKREEVTALETQVAAKQAEVTLAEATLAGYRLARDSYRDTYARVTRVGKAVPADDDVRSLMVQLDSAAQTSKVNFRSITAGGGSGSPSTDPSGTPSTGPTPPPGAIAAGSGAFSTMPFALTFAGDYGHLSDLFTELADFVSVKDDAIKVTGRLMRIDSITLAPVPGSASSELQAEVNASTFVVPRAQEVAGAPAASAAGGTTTATTSTPTTTAAVTGAVE
jgi:Tfp pilus assembly protein PilO